MGISGKQETVPWPTLTIFILDVVRKVNIPFSLIFNIFFFSSYEAMQRWW